MTVRLCALAVLLALGACSGGAGNPGGAPPVPQLQAAGRV